MDNELQNENSTTNNNKNENLRKAVSNNSFDFIVFNQSNFIIKFIINLIKYIRAAFSRQNSTLIVNIYNINNNITINQNNEINNDKNNQINNTNNNNINKNNETNKIDRLLNKGCKHDNKIINVICIILKCFFLIFCFVFITTPKWVYNFLIRLTTFRKTLSEIIKTVICILIFVIIINIFILWRYDSVRNLLINSIKSLFGKSSLPSVTSSPTSVSTERINFSIINNISNNMIGAYVVANQNYSNLIKYTVKLGNEKINEIYHQMETFIIDKTKSAYNSTLVIRDKPYQIYNAINNSIPILKNSTIKILPASHSTVISISNNEIVDSIKNTVTSISNNEIADSIKNMVISISNNEIADSIKNTVTSISNNEIVDSIKNTVIFISNNEIADSIKNTVISISNNEIADSIKNTVVSISNNEIAHSIKNTLANTTPEKINTSVLNKGNYVFNKIKGVIVDTTSSSESTEEATTKVEEIVAKNDFTDNHQ